MNLTNREFWGLLAVGIGGLVLGILVVLSEMNATVHDALELNADVGPLSGKTLFAVLAWLISWGILHLVLRDKDPKPGTVFTWVAIMLGVALLLTFPPIFLSFAAEE